MVKENFVETLAASLRNNWFRPAFTDYASGKTVTYREVANRIAWLHLMMRQCGIRPGDKVALIGTNDINWVTTYLAVVSYGAVIVPILKDFNSNDTLHIINDSDSRLLFSSELLFENLDIHLMSQVVAIVSLKDFHFLAGEDQWDATDKAYRSQYPGGIKREQVVFDSRDNSELASINYTSGTTGFSKGVMTPLNALAGNVKFCSSHHVVYAESRQLVFLPLAHAFGCAFDFLTSFCTGAHAWLVGRTPSAKILIQALQEVKPTCVFTVPLIIEKLCRQMFIPLRGQVSDEEICRRMVALFGGCMDELIVGGAPLNEDIAIFLSEIHFPFTVGYGMTECAPLISYCKSYEYRTGSCGYPLEGLMEVRISQPNHEGIGELEVRGENVMMGYYRSPKATAEIFTADGWLRTGDLGCVDEDGYIYIKGRCKTMLLGPSGQNIYPEEIEAKLNNMPYVMESLVLSSPTGLIALVYPDYQSVGGDRLTQEDLEQKMEVNRQEVNRQLARYEQLQRITLYPHEFEKTPKKNIKRYLYTI